MRFVTGFFNGDGDGGDGDEETVVVVRSMRGLIMSFRSSRLGVGEDDDDEDGGGGGLADEDDEGDDVRRDEISDKYE